MNCMNCGNYMQDNEPFCPMCGAPNAAAGNGQAGFQQAGYPQAGYPQQGFGEAYPGQDMYNPSYTNNSGAVVAAKSSKKPLIIVAAIVLVIGIVVAVLFLFVFKKSGDYVGKWEVAEMTARGFTVKDSVLGIPIAIFFQAEIKDDGTGTLFENESGDNKISVAFKWEEKDGGIVLTKEGVSGELKLTKEGDMLVGSLGKSDDTSYKLKKVDSFTTFDASSITNLLGLGS